MWYQNFYFTQILIISAVGIAFFTFVHTEKKRWIAFAIAIIVFVLLSSASIYIKVKHNSKLRNFKTVSYKFKNINYLPDFEGDKYSGNIITEKYLDEQQLKEVIYLANKQLKDSKKDAKIIWLSFFDDDDADFENLRKDNPNFLAQTQYKEKDYVGFLQKSFISNANYKDIEINFNNPER